jgi:hypothetical protein
MHALLSVFAQGTLQEDALQRVYGFGLDELDNRWRASLGLKPRERPTPGTTPAASIASALQMVHRLPRTSGLDSTNALVFPLLGSVAWHGNKAMRGAR